MTKHPNRVAKGVSEGGQFATSARNETGVALTPDPAPVSLEALQHAREQVQERWRTARDDGWGDLVQAEARRDVDVMAMHVLARDLLYQHPTATHAVLIESDQGPDEMMLEQVHDADGNPLGDPQWGPDDSFTAASDMHHNGYWRNHAREVTDSHGGRDWVLNLRSADADPVVLSDRESVHARSELREVVLGAEPEARSWDLVTERVDGAWGREYTDTVKVTRTDGTTTTVSIAGTHAADEVANYQAEFCDDGAAPPLGGRRGDLAVAAS